MNPLRGIALKILSVTVFTLMATCIKAVSPGIPPGEAVFFRSSFAIPVILAWLAWTGDLRHGLVTSNPLGHFWRGLAGVASMGLGFTALGLLPLPEATALSYAAPLLTVIFGAMFLGEQVRIFRFTAVILGLVGVIIVLSPRLTLASPGAADQLQAVGAMAALLAAVLAALAQVFVRKLVRTEATAAIVFYFSLIAALLSLVTLPFGWAWPTAGETGLLVGAGFLGGLGQMFLTESYRYADVSVIAPFDYTSMLLALAFGYWIFAEVPTLTMLAGAALIVGAGLFIIWREHRLGLERGARRAIPPQG
ncbi:MAG TPA: DMT family transporter [Paracoccaceae bacterium]|nr:DMT family transporter [Paracoccaceae bacterium]